MKTLPDNPNQLVVLGEGEQSGKCLAVDLETMAVAQKFTLEKIMKPKALAVQQGAMVWVAGSGQTNGQAEDEAFVEVYRGNELEDSKKIGKGIYISSMVASSNRVFPCRSCAFAQRRKGQEFWQQREGELFSSGAWNWTRNQKSRMNGSGILKILTRVGNGEPNCLLWQMVVLL